MCDGLGYRNRSNYLEEAFHFLRPVGAPLHRALRRIRCRLADSVRRNICDYREIFYNQLCYNQLIDSWAFARSIDSIRHSVISKRKTWTDNRVAKTYVFHLQMLGGFTKNTTIGHPCRDDWLGEMTIPQCGVYQINSEIRRNAIRSSWV